jgi:hypothetical protein
MVNLKSFYYKAFGAIFIYIFLSLSGYTQTQNLFSDPEKIKDFLDGKTYTIPNYGTITFEYNNSDTRKMRESRIKDGADDEMFDLTFNVSIKRNKSKRREKGGYKIELKIDSNEYLEGEQNPSKKYIQSFYLMRNIIYPIKDFPYYYTLFADGDLYYVETKYKDISLNEYKAALVSGEVNPFAFFADANNRFSSSRYIKCLPQKK